MLIRKDMRWMEEIRLRTQPKREKEVTDALLDIIESVRENPTLESALVYSHHAKPGGFSLILDWKTMSVPTHGSDTAMLILEGLKPLGLLDHTVMVEKGSFKKHNH